MAPALFYIHGFNSSPASFKANLLKAELESRWPASDFVAPMLPASPAAAAKLLDTLAHSYASIVLVGSSLGGYYATWLAERFNLRAVLVNPAVRPYELLAGYVGRQKNLHTGEEYDFTRRHIEEMRALEVAKVNPRRYFLMVTTGDEVLDYRAAIQKYAGSRKLVIEGGDHGFATFGEHIGAVLEFARIESASV